MRFSDIQDDPLNYNFNTILEELENYFTVYVHRYPFIAYINTDQLTLTLHEETLSPNPNSQNSSPNSTQLLNYLDSAVFMDSTNQHLKN